MATNTVDQIRDHLARNSGVNEQTMLPLARDYAQEVQQANARLQSCANLLNRGLRSEALQQANIRPNLIDYCARLDFPEFEEWLEILQFLGIELPQTLNRDAVQQLQEALVDEQPLEDLLRQHRRLAIGKAPLGWRLRVLRNIAKLDSNNQVWFEDIEVWERARLREMQSHLEAATAGRDLSVCVAIDDELKNPNWQVQPPKELIKQARHLREKFDYEGQVRELTKVAQALNDAFCETNPTRANQLRSAWQNIVKGMKKPVPKELGELVEPALLWLDDLDRANAEQEAHLQSVGELERVLASSRSLPDVERAYHMATRGGYALDPMIERRYVSLSNELQLAGKRRQWMVISAVLATCTVAIVALFLWQIERTRGNELALATDSLRKMLDENRLEDAQAFADQISSGKPHVAKQASFTSMVSELTGKVTTEKDRAEAFAGYMAEAEHEDPAKIDVSAINRAEKIARTDADKSAIFRLRTRRQQWEQEAERQDFANLRSELEPIKSALERIQTQPIDALDESELSGLLKRLSDLKSQYVHAGSGGRELVETYQTKLTGLLTSSRKLNSAKNQEAASITKIREAQTLGELKTAIQGSVSSVPNGRYVTDLKKVASEAELWHLVDRWNDLSVEASKYLERPNVAGATGLTSTIDKLHAKLDGHLFARVPPSLTKNLERMAKREEALTELTNDFKEAVLSNLVSVEASLKKGDKPVRFFAYAEHIKRQESTIARMGDEASRSGKFEVVADADGTVESRTLYPPLVVKQQPRRSVAELVDYLEEHRAQILSSWESELMFQMGKVLQNGELDPGHRELLVGRMLQAGVQGSEFMDQKLRSTLKHIEDRMKEPADWFHPKLATDKYAMTEPTKSRVLDPIGTAYRDRGNANADVRALSKARLTWVGVVLKEGDAPVAHLRSMPASAGELVVVSQVSKDEPLQSVLVGQVSNSKATLKTSEPALIVGRPLFLLAQ